MDMDMDRETLIAAAREAAEHAYVPYSHFRVGAALVAETADGPRVVTGANVENASYGLTLCAERSALAATRMLESPGGEARVPISALAVSCIDVTDDAPVWQRTPCGACRQWLAELAPNAVYYVDGIPGELHLRDLLPNAFGFDDTR